ncbi:MAG: hypothetical protein KDD66_12040 [Bdellovibrionales bacterium]|nr:hypothetical protein [Bdellovibrionales bacterium]
MFTKLPLIVQTTNKRSSSGTSFRKVARVLLAIAPAAFIATCVYLKLYDKQLYQWLISEDSIFEWMQCLLYFISSVVAVVCSVRFVRVGQGLLAAAYLIFGLGLFFTAGEEISWGHSMFELELPRYFQEHNVQGDLTLHNLDAVQPFLHNAYVLVGFVGALGWLIVPFLFKGKTAKFLLVLLPGRLTTLYFFPVFLFYGYVEYVLPLVREFGLSAWDASFDFQQTFLLFKDQETVELLLAAAFLIHSLLSLRFSARAA